MIVQIMCKKICLATFSLLFFGLGAEAQAIDPARFDATPLSEKCFSTAAAYWHLLEYQVGPLSEAEAIKRYASAKSDPALPLVAIRNAYAYKGQLDNDFLSDYMEWTCKAGELNTPIAPIAELADAARQCYGQNPDLKNKVHACFGALRNKALGFPPAYVRIERD